MPAWPARSVNFHQKTRCRAGTAGNGGAVKELGVPGCRNAIYLVGSQSDSVKDCAEPAGGFPV